MNGILEESGVFDKALNLIHHFTGISIPENKHVLVQARLKKRMGKLKLKTYDSYLDYLQDNKEEVSLFIDAVTTNETSFFRTSRVWNGFKEELLPKWHQGNPGKPINIWSAAASSGEEIYTIAMILEEFIAKGNRLQHNLEASDISEGILENAMKGVYSGRNIKRLESEKPKMLETYFLHLEEDSYQIIDRIRRQIKFKCHNLFNPASKRNHFNFVFLRNVLIYFSDSDQEKVLKHIYNSLVPGGYLYIGESESLKRLNTKFKFVSPLLYIKEED